MVKNGLLIKKRCRCCNRLMLSEHEFNLHSEHICIHMYILYVDTFKYIYIYMYNVIYYNVICHMYIQGRVRIQKKYCPVKKNSKF